MWLALYAPVYNCCDVTGPIVIQGVGLPRTFKGGLTIGPGYNGCCSAPNVTRSGRIVGVYIDDTTSNIGYWIHKSTNLFPTVLVSIAMGGKRPSVPVPGVIYLQEWYPYHSGFPLSAWGPIPRSEGYIIQWRYPGFHGTTPPTRWQRLKLLAQVLRMRPKYIFLY